MNIKRNFHVKFKTFYSYYCVDTIIKLKMLRPIKLYPTGS